ARAGRTSQNRAARRTPRPRRHAPSLRRNQSALGQPARRPASPGGPSFLAAVSRRIELSLPALAPTARNQAPHASAGNARRFCRDDDRLRPGLAPFPERPHAFLAESRSGKPGQADRRRAGFIASHLAKRTFHECCSTTKKLLRPILDHRTLALFRREPG